MLKIAPSLDPSHMTAMSDVLFSLSTQRRSPVTLLLFIAFMCDNYQSSRDSLKMLRSHLGYKGQDVLEKLQ